MLTERMQANRRTRVGASEVSALMGEGLYGSPATIFDRLVYGIETEVNERMRVGLLLEHHFPAMLKWRGMVSRAVHRSYVHPTLPLVSHPDLYVSPYAGLPRGIGEAKVSGAHMRAGEVPRWWWWQLQTHLLLTKRDVGWLVVLNGSRLVVEAVEPDTAAHDRIEERVAWFAGEHLATRSRPTDTRPLIRAPEKKAS